MYLYIFHKIEILFYFYIKDTFPPKRFETMNPMLVAALNKYVMSLAEKHHGDCNPFALQMYFTYMNDTDLRCLLDEEQPADATHFRLVAHCMLKYYYDRFQGTSGLVWEDADGNLELNDDDEFPKEREYWRNISEDTSPPQYTYEEHEDPEELAAFRARPRFFSREASIKL